MVAVCLDGRLGNQLFQYGFAASLSKRYKTFYIIDDRFTTDVVKKYFKPITLTDNVYARKLLRRIFVKKLPILKQTGFEDDCSDCDFTDNKYYQGFFQSLCYIDNIKYELKKIFRIKDKYRTAFSEKYSYLFNNEKVLAIHFRIGDYAHWGSDQLGGVNLVLPEIYYENALRQIPDLDTYKVVLVTDDVKNAHKYLPSVPNKIIISDQEIIDFQILMHANKLIISNSTFAWWASVLNIKNAQVFAPEFWIGFKVKKEYPNKIINPDFVKVAF